MDKEKTGNQAPGRQTPGNHGVKTTFHPKSRNPYILNRSATQATVKRFAIIGAGQAAFLSNLEPVSW